MNPPDPQPTTEMAVEIAGFPLRLRLNGLSPDTLARLAQHYAAFVIPPGGDVPQIDMSEEPGEPFIPIRGGLWRIDTRRQGSRVEFVSYLERGWFDLNRGDGQVMLRPKGDPENYLRVMYAWRCLEAGGLMLHSAGLVRNGRGFAFFGRSTSGKTTVTRLSQDAHVLSDDIIILRTETVDGVPGVRVYGVPFRGALLEAARLNLSAPLHGLFTLTKAGEHRLENLPAHEAVGRMAACAPFVMKQPENAGKVLAACAEICRRVPVRALHFRKDPGFWRLIDAES